MTIDEINKNIENLIEEDFSWKKLIEFFSSKNEKL